MDVLDFVFIVVLGHIVLSFVLFREVAIRIKRLEEHFREGK